jgi:hypothetical protein
MIRVDCEQGSEAWHRARAGVVTASEWDNILTPGTLQPAKGRAYLHRLAAERLLGAPLDTQTSPEMERGKEMEPEARAYYEEKQGVTTEAVGFLVREDRRVGCSPDWLVGDDGIGECKVPMAPQHVANFLDPEQFVKDHRGQVQAMLALTGRAWVDLISFNPVLPTLIVRVPPDPEWRKKSDKALTEFLIRLDEAVAKVRPSMPEPTPFNDVPFPEEAFDPGAY